MSNRTIDRILLGLIASLAIFTAGLFLGIRSEQQREPTAPIVYATTIKPIRFYRIEERGGSRVAVLHYDFADGMILNRKSLLDRIANMEADGHDASVELAALAALTNE